MGQRALDSKDEHDGVDGPESKEQGVDADVKEGRRAGVICLIHLERIKREKCRKALAREMDGRRTDSTRSAMSQWKHLTNRRKPNMRRKGTSNSSRKMVKARRDSVTNIHV